MHIKRFEGATMEEALAQVRATLGPDALILSSRTTRRRGAPFGLLARSQVEVQAAIPRGPDARASTERDALGDGPERGEQRVESERELREIVDALRREMSVLRRREQFEEEVRSELRGLRSAVGRMVESRPGVELDRVVASLSQAGLDWMHAQSLVEEWQAKRAEGVEKSLERILSDRIDARLAPPRSDAEGRIRILVGAPGAGKTTTVAKLAGRNDEGERDVSLVSLDPFRIGAREQLRAFAGLLESPYSELSAPAELTEIARRYPDRTIFVDTAGRSPGDDQRLVALDGLRSALGREASVELVVDATSRRDVARAQLARFGALAPDRLILTKLDECESLAPVVNLLLDDRCPPVCWLGTGQRVPEDLEVAEPALFAQNVMGRAA